MDDSAKTSEGFKKYVHERLDKMGVPHDPDPKRTAETGCRIGSRLNYIEKRLGRFSGADPQTTLKCEACEEVVPTTISEVWSEAHPEGRLERLCKQCVEACAAG